jgi:hypothetical protein
LLNWTQASVWILGQGWSLIRSSAFLCSYTNLYPIITKLLAVLRSRPGNLHFDLDYNNGDYNYYTNHSIKCVPSQLCSILPHVNSENLYKWPTPSVCTLNIRSSIIDFMYFRSQHQYQNSKRNARYWISTLTSCTQLVPVCKLQLWISLRHAQHDDYTDLRLKPFLKSLALLRVILCAEIQNDTYSGLSLTIFHKTSFHTLLICIVHTVKKYTVSQYCYNV